MPPAPPEMACCTRLQHIRPKADIAIGLHVTGLDAQTLLPASGLVRLGAEGRLAHWQRSALPTLPPPPAIHSQRLLVVCW